MLRLKATLIAILFVFSLGVSGVKAHRGTNGRVDAQASVDLLNTSGSAKKIRATAFVRGTTGTHDGQGNQHPHKGDIYLHIYLHRSHMSPGDDPEGVFA